MTTAADRAQALAYFTGMGWTPAQAAGIVANLVVESDLNPAAVGDGGQAYGIAQWHADRQAGFAALMGKPIQGSSLEDQMAWVHAELQGTEKAAGDTLRSCTTALQAGACVSMLYERPANRDAEAARRGALAETLLQGEPVVAPTTDPIQVPEPAPQPQVQPAAQPEPPMAAIVPFLPFIAQLIPQLLHIPAVGQVIAAVPVTGAAGGSPHAADYLPLFQTIVDTFTKAVGAPNTAMAIGMAQADPAVQATAAAAVLAHPDVAAQLDALAPTLDKVHGYDKDQWTAQTANLALAQQDKYDVAPVMVQNVARMSWLVASGLGVSIITAIVCKAVWPQMPDYVTVLVALAGPLLGQYMTERKMILSYRFDGSPTSNATALVNQQIAASK